jgi:autotransporter-associated beta strand protein
MALTNFLKSSTSGAALNLGTAWIGGVVPNATTARAVLDTNAGTLTSAALGGSLTWGQLQVLPGSTTNTFTIQTTAGATLTLTPTDVDAANVGLNFTTATRNISMACLVALGSDQQWTIGNTASVVAARTLTTTGIISGAFSLTVAGPGTWTQTTQVNTFGGAGKTVTIKDGTKANASSSSTFGNANNEIVVENNGAIDFATSAITPNQTQFRITGSGSYDAFPTLTGRLYGSLLANAWSNTKTVTIEGTKAVIGLYSSTFAAKITGSVTDTLEIMANFNSLMRLTFTGNDFVASNGLLISSLSATSKTSTNYAFSVGNSDGEAGTNETTVFGALSNTVRVLPSGQLYSAPASVTRKVLRNIAFDGDAANTHMQNAGTTATSILEFAGALTFTGNATNAAEVISTSASGGVVYTGTIAGAGALRCGTAGSKVTFNSIESNPFTSWTGQLQSQSNVVVIYKNGYETLTNSRATITGINLYATNGLDLDITLQHSSYTAEGDLVVGSLFSGRTISFGAGSIDASDITNFYVESAAAANTTVLFPGNITGQLVFGNAGADSSTATMVVSGTNTRLGTNASVGWTGASNLSLNSEGAFGSGSSAINNLVIESTAILDNSSVSAVTLLNGGVKQLNANFSWAGTNDLNMGSGNVTYSGDRTITFTADANTGTLKFPGAATTTTATFSFRVGGSTASAKQRITLGGANASLVAATAADQHSVTAGYFRIENNNGLGAAGTTTAWWVGATNLGVQTTKAALELAGVTTPATKNVNIYNTGPNDDGALIGVSGTSVFSGAISVPNVAGTRIGVKSGATLTLLGSGIYPNLNPTNVGTPLAFTAESGGTLNQDRSLGANVSTVTVTGGSGTVVFSRANTHTGAMTCSAGTTKVTHVNASSTGNVVVSAGATLESTVQSNFQSTLSLGTISSATRAILKFAA